LICQRCESASQPAAANRYPPSGILPTEAASAAAIQSRGLSPDHAIILPFTTASWVEFADCELLAKEKDCAVRFSFEGGRSCTIVSDAQALNASNRLFAISYR
jgi:hypothetical protein